MPAGCLPSILHTVRLLLALWARYLCVAQHAAGFALMLAQQHLPTATKTCTGHLALPSRYNLALSSLMPFLRPCRG